MNKREYFMVGPLSSSGESIALEMFDKLVASRVASIVPIYTTLDNANKDIRPEVLEDTADRIRITVERIDANGEVIG